MEGEVKAIEIQGIVRNRTKLGVQDGQAEDLINLRFVDGAWRASGDGRLVHTMSGTQYTQLYVHTNVYHHLLGVNSGTLYWFAEIGTDGVSFCPLDNTTDRTNWPSDMQSLPTAPVALTTVSGNVDITQTGHLLAIIDEAGDFEYVLFKTGTKEYVQIQVDANGEQYDRNLYPYGGVHFNVNSPFDPELEKCKEAIIIKTEGIQLEQDQEDSTWTFPVDIPVHDAMTAFGKATEKNLFVNPFLVCAAIRLYDGTFLYASNPVLIYPRQPSSSGRRFYDTGLADYREFTDLDEKRVSVGVIPITSNGKNTFMHHIGYCNNDVTASAGTFSKYPQGTVYNWLSEYFRDDLPSYMGGFHYESEVMSDNHSWTTIVLGSHLTCSISEELINLMKYNKDVFKSFCIFVTPEVNPYSLDVNSAIPYKVTDTSSGRTNLDGAPVFLKRKTETQLIKSLMSQPMFLLKEYKEPSVLIENPLVDLSDDEGLLQNIVQRDRLPVEAMGRITYLPKITYQYNGRLHMANYKSTPFYGYPLDFFHLHNHSVKVEDDSWFSGVLRNLTGDNDAYHQYSKSQQYITTYADLISNGAPYFVVVVHIDSKQGEQIVSRYIPAYDTTTSVDGRADFIEDLGPILAYPDSRAKQMEIYYVNTYNGEQGQPPYSAFCKYKSFDLKPHTYLNISYFANPTLKPINLSDFTVVTRPYSIAELKALADMQNIEEYYPNGLKVSSAQNPMFFPVENTYQVGSAEILALMSNAIAVGTGQTGAAPLYVFCKDGVYALFVDASGEMTYPNSRVLARDVCNNPRSVTPTDDGVVFTTDRGLMMIAGEQVQKIGAPAEGDVWQYAVQISRDYYHFLAERLTLVAELPQSLCTSKDFLTYLRGAIVNYNHNERELMVTNPAESYSYVRDRDGNWSRRDYTAVEYVNNYPTSYRVETETVSNQNVRKFYKVDEEGDNNTPLEQRKEADNQFFYLSNVIKLDSIGFKQGMRFVVRGQFTTLTKTVPGKSGQTEIVPLPLGCYVFGSYDGRKWGRLGGNEKAGSFRDIGCKVERTDMRFFRVCLAGQITGDSRIDYMEMSVKPSVLNGKIR